MSLEDTYGLKKKYSLEHIGRAQSRWRDVFDTIDENFDKIDEFLCDIATRIHVTHIIADTDQRDFTLDDVYMTDTNSLAIYKNGVRQFIHVDYEETDIREFRMNEPCEAGDKIDAVYNEFYLPDDTSSIEVQIFNALKSLKESVYGEQFDTLDEAIQASVERAKNSVVELNTELINEIQEKSRELRPIQDRIDSIINKLMTGKFFDGVNVIWYEPHMTEDGTISWTNNGGLENPDPVRIKVDIYIPEGTVAIGDSGGYSYTKRSEYGALIREKPSYLNSNPIPHFGLVPLELGGLGGTVEELEKLESYKGPLQYDYYQRKFLPIEGEGVLIRDEEGVRFGIVPPEYGGTGVSTTDPPMPEPEVPEPDEPEEPEPESEISTLSLNAVRAIVTNDDSLDYYSWKDINRISKLAADNPSRYRSWVGRTKKIILKDRSSVPELNGYDLDFNAEVSATIVGINSDDTDEGKAGFTFAITPLLGAYTDGSRVLDHDPSDGTNPKSRNELFELIFKLLPDDLQEVIKDTLKKDYNPINGEVETNRYKLYNPSLSELNLYNDTVARYSVDYELGHEDSGCYEYYSIPRDYFFDRVIHSGVIDRPDDDDQYILRSVVKPRRELIIARKNLQDTLNKYRDMLLSDRDYESSELELFNKLLEKSKLILENSNSSVDDLTSASDNISYFYDSMIPDLESISWDEFFDIYYELNYKSPTVMDNGSQVNRLLGMKKRVDTHSYGSFYMRVISVERDNEEIITLAPDEGVLFNSILRYETGNSGGYNLNDVLFDRMNDFLNELPESLRKYLKDTNIFYETPEEYNSWVISSISIPSIDDLNKFSYFKDDMKKKFKGVPSSYWTRDVVIE